MEGSLLLLACCLSLSNSPHSAMLGDNGGHNWSWNRSEDNNIVRLETRAIIQSPSSLELACTVGVMEYTTLRRHLIN